MQVVVALEKWGVGRDYQRLKERAWAGGNVELSGATDMDEETFKQSQLCNIISLILWIHQEIMIID